MKAGIRSFTKPWQSELSTQIILALVSGIFCGLFFGESCQSLSLIGDAFVGLLRMTVLPYIGVTLIASLGRLSWADTLRLARIGGIVLLVLWAIALLTIAVTPSVFPRWYAGSFFSTAMIEPTASPDFLSYFIPANIFEALSENQVPAIVLFCIFCGLGLAQSKNRDVLLEPLDVVAGLLLQVTEFVTRLTPIGVFAICASTAGTVSLMEISRLQAYFIAYTGGAVFLGMIVLPLLVTTLTPLTYRQVFYVVKDPMLTTFVTGKLIIVLPMLVKNTEKLMRELSEGQDPRSSPAVDALYATAYPFPHVGKLLSMLFIPFAAWFLGRPIDQAEYPEFLFSGLFSYFGGPIVAIPFLLDQTRLPHDMFQLFLVSGVYGERIGDAVGAIHLATLTLISAFAFRGLVRFKFVPIVRYLLIVAVSAFAILYVVRHSLYYTIASADRKLDVIAPMQLLERPVENVVLNKGVPNPDPLRENETLLQRVRRRGILRVGYNEDKVPFAFFNRKKDLVGFDVNMAHALARDLGVDLEFVRFDRKTLVDQLAADHFDIVMSGLVGSIERSEVMQHTAPYMDVNLAFVVADYRARQFMSLEKIRRMPNLRIGFLDLSRGFADRVRELLPNAQLVKLSDNRQYFEDASLEVDALLMSAESGSYFTIMHPEYEVVIPEQLRVKLPLFYAIANQDVGMRAFLEHWMTLRQKDGTSQEFYDHWILGKTPKSQEPRWCILNDVLHWNEQTAASP